jgi:hypothetical protein
VVTRLVAVAFAACVVAAPHRARADATTALRDANAAATAGDWTTVTKLVDPLLGQPLAKAELAEAHRLAGLAAFFAHDTPAAEAHFLAYMRADLDGTLDPALYPPDVIAFFVDVRKNHEAELRALRPAPRRYLILNLLPPAGQLQNHDRTKAIVIGSVLAGSIALNVTSYLLLDSWCTQTGKGAVTCDTTTSNHASAATDLRYVNLVAGVVAIATYVVGVYDGVTRYRQRTREIAVEPYAILTPTSASVGITARF